MPPSCALGQKRHMSQAHDSADPHSTGSFHVKATAVFLCAYFLLILVQGALLLTPSFGAGTYRMRAR